MRLGSAVGSCIILATVVATSGCFRSGTGGGGSVRVSVGGGEGSVQVGSSQGRTGLDRTIAPVVGEPAPVRLTRVFEFEMENGARGVVAERRALPLVHLELRLRGGAAAQRPGEAGLAGLTLALLDEGTETRTSAEIAEALEFLGAELTLREGYDELSISLSVLAPRFAEALEILADIVRNPTFPEREFERVRQERLNQLLQRSDEPRAVAGDRLSLELFGSDHPYGAPLAGTEATLRAFTRADVVSYRERVLHAGNATFVLVGDLLRADAEALLVEVFGEWEGGPRFATASTPAPTTEAARIHLVDRPGAAQSEIRIGRVAVARADPGYFDILVLNTVLGGAFTSRLNANLREEKGWTYGAGSAFQLRRAPGPFLAATAVHTPVTPEAVTEILRELARIADEPIPAAELERAAAYLSLQLPERFETRGGLARELADLTLHELPLDFFDGFVAGVREVTAERVQAAARRTLSGPWVIVVVGDRATLEEPLRDLGVGEVVLHPSPSP
jgi:zinc protease